MQKSKSKNVKWMGKHLKTFDDKSGVQWRATLMKSNDGRSVRAITRAVPREDGTELEISGGVVLPNSVREIKALVSLLQSFLPKDQR